MALFSKGPKVGAEARGRIEAALAAGQDRLREEFVAHEAAGGSPETFFPDSSESAFYWFALDLAGQPPSHKRLKFKHVPAEKRADLVEAWQDLEANAALDAAEEAQAEAAGEADEWTAPEPEAAGTDEAAAATDDAAPADDFDEAAWDEDNLADIVARAGLTEDAAGKEHATEATAGTGGAESEMETDPPAPDAPEAEGDTASEWEEDQLADLAAVVAAAAPGGARPPADPALMDAWIDDPGELLFVFGADDLADFLPGQPPEVWHAAATEAAAEGMASRADLCWIAAQSGLNRGTAKAVHVLLATWEGPLGEEEAAIAAALAESILDGTYSGPDLTLPTGPVAAEFARRLAAYEALPNDDPQKLLTPDELACLTGDADFTRGDGPVYVAGSFMAHDFETWRARRGV